MMKLRAVGEFGTKIALAEQCGVASAVVVVEWATGDFVHVSEFGGGVGIAPVAVGEMGV